MGGILVNSIWLRTRGVRRLHRDLIFSFYLEVFATVMRRAQWVISPLVVVRIRYCCMYTATTLCTTVKKYAFDMRKISIFLDDVTMHIMEICIFRNAVTMHILGICIFGDRVTMNI